MRVAVSNGRTSPAKTQQLAAGAFLEFLILPVGIHLFSIVDVEDVLFEHVTYRTCKSPASHYTARRQNRHVAVTAMTAVVNGIGIRRIRYLEQSLFVEKQCPEMVFQIECRAAILVLLELLPYPL